MRQWTTRDGSDGTRRSLEIEGGQVVCPRRGIVDIERCWTCRDYRGLGTGRTEGLLCAASTASILDSLWPVGSRGRRRS
jgi:hypothetical protein